MSAYIIPSWLAIMPERGFWIFLLLFLEFSCPGWVWAKFGTKFFFLILGLSNLVLAKNNAKKRFFNFLNFFAIFVGIFLPGSTMNGIWDYNFFHYFSAYVILFWLTIMPERGFWIFWIFLLFFSEFSCPGRVWTDFGTKCFFTFSAYLIPFWLKIMPERCFLIF